jgi:nicotinamide mononucleotide (NMN) deamidase PncC
MAQGVCAVGQGSLELEPGEVIALATTGNAGPEGNPIGQVFIALYDGKKAKVRELALVGTRTEIREQTVQAAISLLREHLGD